MKAIRLTHPETASGFNYKFVVTHADLTETADNTAQAITLSALAVGDIVGHNVMLQVKTNVAGLTTCTCEVGVTSAAAQFIASSNLLAAGSEYYTAAYTVGDYPTTAAKNLIATFTPQADEALVEATAGEIWIWANISRKVDRDSVD